MFRPGNRKWPDSENHGDADVVSIDRITESGHSRFARRNNRLLAGFLLRCCCNCMWINGGGQAR